MKPAITNTAIRGSKISDLNAIKDYDDFTGDRRLDFQRGELIVADSGEDQAVGFLRISTHEFMGWPLVSAICVKPSHRRAGIGFALLAYSAATTRSPCIYLTTENSNEAMIALLGKSSWLHVGHVDGFNFSGEQELIFRHGVWPPTT